MQFGDVGVCFQFEVGYRNPIKKVELLKLFLGIISHFLYPVLTLSG